MILEYLVLVNLLPIALVGAWQTLIVPHATDRTADDAPLLKAALASGNFSADSTILFQKGVTYNIFTPVKFPVFQNVEVAIEGNLTGPADIATVQGESRGTPIYNMGQELIALFIAAVASSVSMDLAHECVITDIAAKELSRRMVGLFIRVYCGATDERDAGSPLRAVRTSLYAGPPIRDGDG